MRARRVTCGLLALALGALAHARTADDLKDGAFSIAIVATPSAAIDDRSTASTLRAAAGGPATMVVHFETSGTSPMSCSDAAHDRRRARLDESDKPVVPISAASEWAECGAGGSPGSDAYERLSHLDDTLFADAESPGRAKVPWVRESALRRFRRYRENVRWQAGRVLFATLNLPDNDNDFRLAAGRNGEFEDRTIANRAWLERTFRLATERRLAGVVLFVDAQPRFNLPLRAPDLRSRERDGYYEFKLALREQAQAFKGQVLIVQGHGAGSSNAPRAGELDHPLRDASGRPLERVARLVATVEPPGDGKTDTPRWLRLAIDPADPRLFRVTLEQGFDDPSGELYGTPAR